MEILFLLALILLNGVFAMSEIALVSSRKTRLQQWADENRAGARAALALANEPSHFLSTIQVGITAIGILSGVFGEAAIAKPLAGWLASWPPIAPYAEGAAVVLVVLSITAASLVFGELVPKRLALLNPEAIACFVARPMGLLASVASPLVRLLALVTDGLLSVFGARASTQPPVTEEEIKVLMEQGASAGVFETHEREIVSRVFSLDEERVRSIMTPRTDIAYLDLDEDEIYNRNVIMERAHSRFPVTRGGLENVIGIGNARAMLVEGFGNGRLELTHHLSKPLYVPDSLTVMELLGQFKEHRQHLAMVVNEYGEMQGLVTLNDVTDALVGDVSGEEGSGDSDVVQRKDGSYLLDGAVSVARAKEALGIEGDLPGEEDGHYHTFGGFVMTSLARIPKTGDSFDAFGWRFEVLDMDKNRVDKVLAERLSEPVSEEITN